MFKIDLCHNGVTFCPFKQIYSINALRELCCNLLSNVTSYPYISHTSYQPEDITMLDKTH